MTIIHPGELPECIGDYHLRAIDVDSNALYSVCYRQGFQQGRTHEWRILFTGQTPPNDHLALSEWQVWDATHPTTHYFPKSPPSAARWLGWRPCPNCKRAYR